MSDLPKDAPGLEVDPIEPALDEPAPATDNAQVEGDDLGHAVTQQIVILICPHCGDESEQEVLLAQFVCGACDRPFLPDLRAAA